MELGREDGRAMPRLLISVLSLCLFWVCAVGPQSVRAQDALQSTGTSTAASSSDLNHVQQPATRITEYRLAPELYRKAKRLGTIRFIFRLFSFFFSLLALWLILQTRWSEKFRDWAEKLTR